MNEPKKAIDVLMKTDGPNNKYTANGHNPQRGDLPVYLPGNGALLAAIGTFVFSAGLKAALPQIPFLDRMLIVFFLCVIVMVLSALLEKTRPSIPTLVTEPGMFATSFGFKLTSALILYALVIVYSVWW